MPSPSLATKLDAVPFSSLAEALARGEHDAVVVVGQAPLSKRELPTELARAIEAAEDADQRLCRAKAVAVVPLAGPVGRLVLSTTTNLASWEEDVRAIGAATAAGVAQAVAAGARKVLVVPRAPSDARYAQAAMTTALAACAALWEPYELRAGKDRAPRADRVTIASDVDVSLARSLENGRIVARDIGGTEPELMSPEGMARYCEAAFEGTQVTATIKHFSKGFVGRKL